MVFKSLIALMLFVASDAYAQQNSNLYTGGTSRGGRTTVGGTVDYKPPSNTAPSDATTTAARGEINEVGTCPQNTVRSLVHRPKTAGSDSGTTSYVQCLDVATAYPCYNARIGGGTAPANCPAGSPLFQSQ